MKNFVPHSLRHVLPCLIFLTNFTFLPAQKPIEDFPVEEIKINGKKVQKRILNEVNALEGAGDKEDILYKFKLTSIEQAGYDSLMQGWIDDSLFQKTVSRRVRSYWMGLEVEVPEKLRNHVFYFPVPNPYVKEVWVNNEKTFDISTLNKSGLKWTDLQNAVPVSLNKKINHIYFRVNFTDEHTVFSYENGKRFRTYPELIQNINQIMTTTSMLSGGAIFYTTVTLLYFLLYFMGMRENKYLWGALFTVCCGAALFLLRELVNGSGIFSPSILISFALLSLLLPFTFLQFIKSFFNYKIPRFFKWVLIVVLPLIGLKFLFSYTIDVEWLDSVIVVLALLSMALSFVLSIFYTIKFIVMAIRERKDNVFIILAGMIIPPLIYTIYIFEMLFLDTKLYSSNLIFMLVVLPVPLSILISLVRGYSGDNKNLKLQLTKVEELTASALREQEEKQKILSNQNEMLEQQVIERTQEITEQKKVLEEKNHEILDSINYAKRIQQAILPPVRLFSECLPQSFVLYKPKDIVAGDFYWLLQKDGAVYFAAADCTGHGVPGAMVSVVCNNALNRSVNEFSCTDPSQILNQSRKIIIEEFEKSDDDVKDGMDISFCKLEGRKLSWAGANNPLWIIRKNSDEVMEIKPDKQPIGKYMVLHDFTTHHVELTSGDQLYVFTDGYQDQFGGDKGKKFKATQLKKLLLKNRSISMPEQCAALESVFNEWKGRLEQIDDVCIIGVRV